MSLSNRFAGDDDGEFTGVTVMGSFPLFDDDGGLCGGVEDEIKMGKDPL